MADRTGIEWTDATWNPIRAHARGYGGKAANIGWHCEHVSEGCRNCYAEGINKRLGNGFEFKPGKRGALDIFVDDKALLAPLKWKRPRMIFVCSMTDLFADFVTDEMIDRVFAVMALCPQHRFQVLTKRSARMRAWFARIVDEHWLASEALWLADWLGENRRAALYDLESTAWPLPNVWLGVSAEDQKNADERIPDLLATPAAVRFVSLEPLLGAIDLTAIEAGATGTLKDGDFAYPKRIDALTGEAGHYPGKGTFHPESHRMQRLDWVIVGGESGPNARPMHPDWPRKIRDDCAAAGVPFFFKQNGQYAVTYDRDADDPDWRHCGEVEHKTPLGRWLNLAGGFGFHGDRVVRVDRVGKKRAGRLLDGVEHNGMPR